MKKKLPYFICLINALFILTIFILNYFYQLNNFNFTLKCITSGLFALQGIINFLYLLLVKKVHFLIPLIMTIGLVLAMLGDVTINHNFIIGAAIFALGHVAFLISYFLKQKGRLLDIVFSTFLIMGTVFFIATSKHLVFNEAILKAVVIIYAVIISIMFSKSLSNFIYKKNLHNLIITISSLLFLLSDLFLLIAWFSNVKEPWQSNVCMALYYPALTGLALSLIIPESKKATK
ncbi:MAG: hypothetical protein IKB70_11790 [Bacilli bacterium]|nr:hypothetical protein [Bacilli bacterium]